ncbi:hypothetical protein D6Z83_26290 [Pseudoroseomonas wenyumeiae]|uniref:IstB-like ATP-binding domain-containing protein n=1 Tax=Teichococcus wenyumeiae TaxID=2478470 RepID=A0A3A9J689_9PROT|nr:hypothetical protein D6Z83_26290 [Pseudoroseomonas wenyumeiae]
MLPQIACASWASPVWPARLRVRSTAPNRRHPDAAELGFDDRLAMLVDREALERDGKRLAARLRFAGLRQQATPEDVDHRATRGLDRALFGRLTNGEWIERHQDLLVTGPTGTGKTWLSCALGHRACRDNRSVLYQRVPPVSPPAPGARILGWCCPPLPFFLHWEASHGFVR